MTLPIFAAVATLRAFFSFDAWRRGVTDLSRKLDQSRDHKRIFERVCRNVGALARRYQFRSFTWNRVETRHHLRTSDGKPLMQALYDPTEFAAKFLLDKLEITKKEKSIAIHVPCSSKKMKKDKFFEQVCLTTCLMVVAHFLFKSRCERFSEIALHFNMCPVTFINSST